MKNYNDMVIGSFRPLHSGRNTFPQFVANSKRGTMQSHPAVNIIESATGFEIAIAAPGLQKDDFKVTLEKDVLKVSAEKMETQESVPNEQFVRREFSFHSFEKTFNLGAGISTEEVKVVYENGILKVFLQKQTAVQAKKISVQ